MKKESQKEMNQIALSYIEMCNTDIEYSGRKYIGRLRTCNAQVWETETFFILTSYRTDVAIIDKATNTGIDILRYVYGYTSTSAQHIAKFFRDFGGGKYGVEHIIRYYPV